MTQQNCHLTVSVFHPNSQLVVVWNTLNVSKGEDVTILAKAHTDVDIFTMKVAFFDDTRYPLFPMFVFLMYFVHFLHFLHQQYQHAFF